MSRDLGFQGFLCNAIAAGACSSYMGNVLHWVCIYLMQIEVKEFLKRQEKTFSLSKVIATHTLVLIGVTFFTRHTTAEDNTLQRY